MNNNKKLSLFSVVALASLVSMGDVVIFATEDYVDERTTLHPVTNAGVVAGYTLGIQTNLVVPSSVTMTNDVCNIVTNNSSTGLNTLGLAYWVDTTNAIASATPDLSSRTTFLQATNIAESVAVTNQGALVASKKYTDDAIISAGAVTAPIVTNIAESASVTNQGALTASKKYTDEAIISACFVTAPMVTNIVTNVVTRSYVEALGVGLDTNAVQNIIQQNVDTNYLCTVVKMTNSVAGVKAYSEETFLKKSGGTITGPLIVENTAIYFGHSTSDSRIEYNMAGSELVLCGDEIHHQNLDYTNDSPLTPDGSPVATSNMVNRMMVDQNKKTYALFLIPLNPEPQTGTTLSGFELKGTTNNFTAVGDDNRMVFYNASVYNETTTGDSEFRHDWCRMFIASKQVDDDVRKWKRIKNTSSSVLDDYDPKTVAVLIDTSMFRSGHGTDWCYEENEELIWSYVRFFDYDAELDDNGESQLWRPIMPVKWYNKLPSWANQTD